MLKRVIICSGGDLGDWALPYLDNGDYLIGADKGAYYLAERGLRMDAALGDFDSVTEDQLRLIEKHSSGVSPVDPVDKNYTDTELAFRHALELLPRHIVILGATGSRLDHTLANVHLLAEALRQGVQACIIDRSNRITLTDKVTTVARSDYDQVSLLPLSPEVKGITLTGFRYPLRNATLRIGQSLGISNVLAGETGRIEVGEGLLLVIESRG